MKDKYGNSRVFVMHKKCFGYGFHDSYSTEPISGPASHYEGGKFLFVEPNKKSKMFDIKFTVPDNVEDPKNFFIYISISAVDKFNLSLANHIQIGKKTLEFPSPAYRVIEVNSNASPPKCGTQGNAQQQLPASKSATQLSTSKKLNNQP
ncbi:MAG: hypothetical protein HQL32_11440 [Planctomycetes bacterium]|nr:hypothetical protein [Planctomycetota bacterium]